MGRNFFQEIKSPLLSMDNKIYDFIASFAKSKSAFSSTQYDWVARRGKYGLYTVLADLAPTVRHYAITVALLLSIWYSLHLVKARFRTEQVLKSCIDDLILTAYVAATASPSNHSTNIGRPLGLETAEVRCKVCIRQKNLE